MPEPQREPAEYTVLVLVLASWGTNPRPPMRPFAEPTVVALMLLLARPSRAEDVTIVFEVSAPNQASVKTAVDYITAGRIRTARGSQETILETATKRMVGIDCQRKEYFETSLADMAAVFRKLDSQMLGNPIMERMMGKVADVTLRREESARFVAGVECEMYHLSMTDLEFEVCAAKDVDVPAEYFDARKLSYASMGPLGRRYEKMLEEMKRIRGFPLSERVSATLAGLQKGGSSDAIKVTRGPVSPAVFEIPADYRRKASPFQHK